MRVLNTVLHSLEEQAQIEGIWLQHGEKIVGHKEEETVAS
jgi:hypothetical protein